VDGRPEKALMAVNYAAIPIRPAGAAWSSVRDMLKYVSLELAHGKTPDGKTYIASGPLLERRKQQVSIGSDESYGMGLMVDTTYGVRQRLTRRDSCEQLRFDCLRFWRVEKRGR
jgi:hypothetical protein